MYSRVETITPEIATEYLKHNKVNRKVRAYAVSNYARDMKDGKWELSPQGISFYENGDLADGQHRLLAVTRAGIPVDFYVTYDVPASSTIQDRCMTRKQWDSLVLQGIDKSVANNSTVAIANFLFRYDGITNPSIQMLNSVISVHGKMMALAQSIVKHGVSGKTTAGNASCASACFCALFCGIPQDGLDTFSRVVNTGFYDGNKESAAIVLRNYMEKEYTGKSSEDRRAAFNMCLNAIKDFTEGRGRKIKYDVLKEPPFWRYTESMVLAQYKSKVDEHKADKKMPMQNCTGERA